MAKLKERENEAPAGGVVDGPINKEIKALKPEDRQAAIAARIEALRKKKEAMKAALIKAGWDAVKKLDKEFEAEGELFVPFKDRDGSTVPALILGHRLGIETDAKGEAVIDPETREMVEKVIFTVFAFTKCDAPGVRDYELPKGGK